MKYWNKSKKYREQQWKHLDGPLPVSVREAKRWCQLQPSKGRFYHSPYTGWWFELDTDASWFALKWLC
jgi:hypothetical protein